MRKPWVPSIVPAGSDQDVYLVVDDFGQRLGRAWRETDYEATGWETLIGDLLTGQYNDPFLIVSFNVTEGWSRDVSEDVAQELRMRCDLQGREVPENIQGFVERHEGNTRQLTLRLA